MKQFQSRALPLGLLCATLASPAFAGVVPPASHTVQLCNLTGISCRPVKMPAAAGVVTKLIGGNFVPGRTSWIAYGDKRASLCYEHPPAKNASTRTACVPILSSAPYKDLTLRDLGGGTWLIAAVGKGADQRAVTSFMGALARAQDALMRHAAKPLTVNAIAGCSYQDSDAFPTCTATDSSQGSYSFYPGTLASLNGDEDGTEYGATGGGCEFVPPNTWVCKGTRGGGFGIPDGIPGPYDPGTTGSRGGAGTSGAGMSDVEMCQKTGQHCGVIQASADKPGSTRKEREEKLCYDWLVVDWEYYRILHQNGALSDDAWKDRKNKIQKQYEVCMADAADPHSSN